MTYIKKIVMKGFKSFARETTINLDRYMNVVVGPNGSGKSNITDSICFVLGRLSIKSIRAAKSAHLIFSGNQHYKPANFAYVEIVWDNSDKTFAVEEDEVLIRRIVKKNGQSIYRINNQTKTRQEVIELLSQAGVDPYGFNIILQGEIQKFVKMSAEERRRVVEEVSGISVYEMRKEKSLKELEKTEEKLKQINAILRERTNYLRNLDEERQQALKFKKLEITVKRCKASIINRSLEERQKELEDMIKNIDSKNKEIQKFENQILKTQNEANELNQKIEGISGSIQRSSGVEQDALLNEISLLRQEIAGFSARKENFENQLIELERRKNALDSSIKIAEDEISQMSREKGKNIKSDLEAKKYKLEKFEESKREYYQLKSGLSSVSSQLDDKKRQIIHLQNDSNYLLQQIEEKEKEIKINDSIEKHKEAVGKLKESLDNNKKLLSENQNILLEKEKSIAVFLQIIKDSEKINEQVSKLDICPLCQTKITKEHIDHVIDKSNNEIADSKHKIHQAGDEIAKIKESINDLNNKISEINEEINARVISSIRIQTISERKIQLKRNDEQIGILDSEIKNIDIKKKSYENKISISKISDEQYEKLRLEINELQRSEERNLGVEIVSKQRELERIKLAIKQILRDKEEISENIKSISDGLDEKTKLVEKKEEQAEVLKKKYKKMFEEKNSLQDNVRNFESLIFNLQNQKRILESHLNNLNIEKAQINAKIDTLKEDLKGFEGIGFINLNIDKLRENLQNAEFALVQIGSVNLKALEVYEDIKKEYDKIKEKVDQLENEKTEILKIIEQIDRKKKRTFLRTLEELNEKFSRNFSQLSEKGIVILEPQDKKEVFNAGVDVIVKVGAGKYFDITSLSGGEQTLVALSLIFAIQELRPYCFYIFDEIDAALDKRNSEKLAYLLKKHMKHGQYLIITHNDSIISESSNILYGVSMQEGISKVLSIEI